MTKINTFKAVISNDFFFQLTIIKRETYYHYYYHYFSFLFIHSFFFTFIYNSFFIKCIIHKIWFH